MGNSLVLYDETMTPIDSPLLPPPYLANSQPGEIVFPYNITAVYPSVVGGISDQPSNIVIDSSDNDDDNGDDQSE